MESSKRRQFKSLEREIRAILILDWDPIGVGSEVPDEYDYCVHRVISLLLRGAGKAALAAMLDAIVRQEMGLAPRAETSQMAADRCLQIWAKSPLGTDPA